MVGNGDRHGKDKRICREAERGQGPFKQHHFYFPCNRPLDFQELLCELHGPIACDAIGKDKQWGG